MCERSLTLANGLRCHLSHQPDARESAALVRVGAGSLHEPDRWPGLAHLLEHLLFCGSAGFTGDERLMPWLQQQGGQVNATTQLSRSAWFFQLPAQALAAGVARLADMLAPPLLTGTAITREAAVIEAEYQLLRHHAETLSEAALLDAAGGALRRFRVGSAATFGDNVTELQQALRLFHQQHFVAANQQLWLSGPQSLGELQQLAEAFAVRQSGGAAHSLLPAISAPEPVETLIQLAGEESFWLSLFITGEENALRDNVTLLEAFWQDEAPGSLMAQLRSEQLCASLQCEWLWQSADHSWLALRFSAPALSASAARRIEQLFWQHLRAVRAATPAQHRHYLQLAQQDFAALSPLTQLRGRALGSAPSADIPADFTGFIAALPQASCTRLLTQRQLSAVPYTTQGFCLQRAPWPPTAAGPVAPVNWSFYPCADVRHSPELPANCPPLLRASPVQPRETLLVRPAFYHTLSDEAALSWQQQLRPRLAALRHAGGSGRWQQHQGVWQLVINLPDDAMPALQQLPGVLAALNAPVLPQPHRAAQSIVIRQLLEALPQQLLAPAAHPAWQAAWCGHSESVSQHAAHGLSEVVQPQPAPARAAALQHGVSALRCAANDQALLLFIPLPAADDASLAALRALALMFEPRFFQRLRVGQQIGYVVSARYQRVADVDGLQLALQSPSIGWRTLLQHCKAFLRDMVSELAAINDETLQGWQATLLAQCQPHQNADAASEALRKQQGLPVLTPEAIAALTLPQLQRLHQRLLRERRRWRLLINQRK
ncbi:pyrroloquinoline quinone biosynthesis protein PqqF [Pantoea sp. R102]|uniref:pyrroloquinoline quinone biosynthesis protein PqqF n=1 Tax=Pantoea sp. R102 TaxID=2507583 RepID=UPI0010A7CB0F|nr:pyrroloquinoline quinone biosynthesis protein PqqF [Pantoea sp. R102]THD38642.1 pyrroloquinoline quinone biosynthesis protein PqqF [Pantoea sp. R102]